MKRDNLTHAVEDYLKTIYDLTRSGERASTNQIAERMAVTPASASGMIQKLAATAPPLVEYEKHHGVLLTEDGEKIALEIIRYHRLLELFLQETLGFSWDQVHAEADRLEHVISPDFAERISQVLGEPVHDPHGHPIPTRDLKLPPDETTLSLQNLRPGQQAYIRRVEDDDPGLQPVAADQPDHARRNHRLPERGDFNHRHAGGSTAGSFVILARKISPHPP